MAFSEMSAREKTIMVVLAVIIVIALVGIGILAAKLIADGRRNRTTGITVVATTSEELAGPVVTATLVANPTLEGAAQGTPVPVSQQPVAVVHAASPSGLLPVILTNQPLQGGHRYRLGIMAEDGSSILIRGSWSQSARSASGDLELPLPKSFEAKTPFDLDIIPPMANPSAWSFTVSAVPKDLLGQPPRLVITIWDVTGSQ
jgi:hypothetical protein